MKLEQLTSRQTRLLQKKTKLEKRIKATQKSLRDLDLDLNYLQKKIELLRLGDAVLLGGPEAEGPLAGAGASEYLPGPSGAPPVPAPPDPPKAAPSGPKCRSCGEVGKLYRTARELGSGKSVPLLVCGSCKTEQIAYG